MPVKKSGEASQLPVLCTLSPKGWLVIVGAEVGALTVRIAGVEVTLPTELLTVTV